VLTFAISGAGLLVYNKLRSDHEKTDNGEDNISLYIYKIWIY